MLKKSLFHLIYCKLWIFYLITPFVINPFGYKGIYSFNKEIYYNFKEYYFLVISVIILIFIIIRNLKGEFFFISSIHKLLLILLLIIFIGTFWAEDKISTFRTLLGFIFLYITYLYSTTLKNDYMLIIKILVYIGVIQSLIGIFQYFDLYYKIVPFYAETGRMKMTGTIGNINRYSHYITICFLTSSYFYFFLKSKLKRNLFFVFSGIIFYAILLTQTRGSYLGLIISLAFLNFKFKNSIKINKKKKFSFLLATVIILFIMTQIVLGQKIARSLSLDDINKASSGRLTFWKIAVELIKEKPILGHGTGSFDHEEMRKSKEIGLETTHWVMTDIIIERDNIKSQIMYKKRPGHAHNEYIQIIVENGLLGFFIVFLISFNIVIFYKRNKCNLLHVSYIIIILLFFSIISFISFPLHVINNSIVLFLLLGIFDRFTAQQI
jgi:O-antigen ligase